jgi:hypothetical protein
MLGQRFLKYLAALAILPKTKSHAAMMAGIAATVILASSSGQQTAPASAKTFEQPIPEVKYFATKSGNTSLPNVLLARANGKTYELIGKSQQKCLRLIAEKDFDGNGSVDALVEHVTACGGNCCSDTFFFVSSFDNGRFEISQEFADSWKDPVIEVWNGRSSVVVISTNAGANLDRPVEVTRRFVLENGKAMQVEESRRKDIESLVEMRSEMFASEMSGEAHTHTIEYDLDGDGAKDVISGKLWQRWGSIVWSVRFGNGKEFSSDQACKRIGVLATKTNGVNDLVCDQDTVLHWTGSAYK